MRSKFFKLFVCTVGGCIFIVLLYFLTQLENNRPNSFYRKLPSHKIIGVGFIELKDKSSYFAGTEPSQILLGSFSTPNKLMQIALKSRKIHIQTMKGLDSIKLYEGFYLRTKANHVFLFDGNSHLVCSGSITSGTLNNIQPTPYFSNGIPVSDHSFMLRVINKNREYVLKKYQNGKSIRQYKLEKQGEGIFSTDGSLISTGDKRFFYTYYYRNAFLCLDTNLNLIYKGKTIDTTSHVKIRVSHIKSSHQSTLASPPQFVNKQCSANDQYLFVHSSLKADNEIQNAMNGINPIDIYSVQDGKYQFSFYVDDIKNQKLKDFRVVDHTLIALYDHYLYFYELRF